MNITGAESAALIVDLSALSLVIGATVWFFFIQSPVLYRLMDRERFVPIQMRLSAVLLTTLMIALIVLTAVAILVFSSLSTTSVWTAAFALVAVVLNKFVVFPVALRAGAGSLRQKEGSTGTGRAGEFVVRGAGTSASAMHRVVVLFVVLMVAGTAAHGISLISAILSK